MANKQKQDYLYINENKIPTHLIKWTFSRSPGPWGQNVNTSNTKAQANLKLDDPSLDPKLAQQLQNKFGSEIRVVSSAQRSQLANRRAAMSILTKRLSKALQQPNSKRIPTKPTKNSSKRRLESKAHRRMIKSFRSNKFNIED